tara:strand:+ start:47 stop:241 length:195 start_codon:yes stop_codon:yes gene_type:complete
MNSHVITEYGKQNIFAKETKPYIDETYKGHVVEAEQLNGRLAMIGIVALLGAYITTGQIIPMIW